jgi:LysR family hydrogen peroxide-inducible transcriptional activator
MKNLPTLRQLQYLIALYDHGSFQKAADSCNVSQSTLSSGIADLENTLKSPLVDRNHKRRVVFTRLGEEVARDGRSVLKQMEEVTHRAHSLKTPLSWPLTMGIIPTIAPYFLPRILKPLQKSLPSLELHIQEMRSEQILEKLDEGRIDFALMAFPYDTGKFDQKILFEEKFVCAAPPNYFKNKKTITYKDLENEKLLLLEDGHCLRDHALAACRLGAKTEMRSLSAASLSTLVQLVQHGYGLTLLPEMAITDSQSLPKSLTLKSFSGNAPTRKIGFCFKSGGFRAGDITLVVNAIAQILKKPAKD